VPPERSTPASPASAAPVSVLVVSHAVQVWGAQLRLLDLAPPLAERGVRLTLAADPASPVARAWVARGLPLEPLVLPEHRSLRRPDGRRAGPGQLLSEARAVAVSAARVARTARGFDVVLSFSLHAHLEVALGARLARTPVVVEVVDIVVPGFGRRLLRAASALATLTTANSAATASTLGPRAADVVVVHPGVDVDRFSPGPVDPEVRAALGGADGRPLVGIVGRVDPEKGVDVLARALARATGAAREAGLAVVGDVAVGAASSGAAVRADAERLLGDRVRFVGRRDDVPAVHRALDVLVNASVAEPFGRSVLEAMASGTPVVATRSGGIPEFVEDGVTGVLVPPGDDGALADALDRVLGDEALRYRLAEAARASAVARLALPGRYELVADVFRRAAGHRGGHEGGWYPLSP
jgi:glycosyltransferase involved in cell wall biosynthesis